ncbi:MAG: hypothetical protein WCQ44_01055 [Opitutaceae bacterium]
MAAVKRLNTSYTIDTTDVIITGNLTVQGSQSALETTNTTLKDNIIILNDGEVGAGVTLGTAGIQIARGSLANVALRWNESFDKWQITNDGTTYSNLVSSSTGLTAVIDDPAPALGGNLNTNSYTISSNVGNMKFGGNIQINNTTVAPSAVTNATVLYAATPNSGTSGIYVVNDSAVNEELITKKRAFAFSLIL